MLVGVYFAIIIMEFKLKTCQVLEFVDDHGNEVLNLGSFTLLPQHVVRLILNREELKADEFSKFQVYISFQPLTNTTNHLHIK